jgi:C4-type Zn-finger protein
MIFVWIVQLVKAVRWFFHIPSDAERAIIDINAKCPVCGARKGKLRTVIQQKQGPQAEGAPVNIGVFCQHSCGICGARWFDEPIKSNVNPGSVLASIARDDFEVREDRANKLFTREENTRG